MNTLPRCLVVLALAALGCGSPVNSDGMLTTTGGDSGATGNGGSSLCPGVCAAQARAGCAANCMGQCTSGYQQFPQCAAQFDALLRCGATATFTCTNGNPTSRDCQAEALAVAGCTSGGSGNDAGTPTD